nr:PREDICTED: uncharacterized protein LOC106705665 [Latimeria chalumnae]|eukprot:XP_014350988.1 PREDICTED: uncharacterized protein LOC106705665 [Latimeria chalumnae]
MKEHNFTFDAVFNLETQQKKVYLEVVAPLIPKVLCGYNTALLVSSDNVSGEKSLLQERQECDIVKQVIEDIFQKIEATKGHEENLTHVSFIQVKRNRHSSQVHRKSFSNSLQYMKRKKGSELLNLITKMVLCYITPHTVRAGFEPVSLSLSCAILYQSISLWHIYFWFQLCYIFTLKFSPDGVTIDLLNPHDRELVVEKHPLLGLWVAELSEIIVSGSEAAHSLYLQGLQTQQLTEQHLSRCSSLFTITLKQREIGCLKSAWRQSYFQLFDLTEAALRSHFNHDSLLGTSDKVTDVGPGNSVLSAFLTQSIKGNSHTLLIYCLHLQGSCPANALSQLSLLEQVMRVTKQVTPNLWEPLELIRRVRGDIREQRMRLLSTQDIQEGDMRRMRELMKELQVRRSINNTLYSPYKGLWYIDITATLFPRYKDLWSVDVITLHPQYKDLWYVDINITLHPLYKDLWYILCIQYHNYTSPLL